MEGKRKGKAIPADFGKRLLGWAKTLDRPLPWRGEKDPYKIWFSEIILQQTRADQAVPYYERFIREFRDVHALANAPIEKVLKLWEGLGYYNRAHNLHRAAKMVSATMGGIYPKTLEGLMVLPGVGSYTGAAIASFAYDLPHPVVDGNVIRVISRLAGIQEEVGQREVIMEINHLAGELLGQTLPSAYNQAIMDFGATWCTPKNPQCQVCPFKTECQAFNLGLVDSIPFKAKKKALKHRFFLFLMIRFKGKIWIVKRGNQDIWRGLHSLPYVEMEAVPSGQGMDSVQHFLTALDISGYAEARLDPEVKRQTLTHQRIHGYFVEIWFEENPVLSADWYAVELENYSNFAFPKLVKDFLSDVALKN